jgi:hypothetical protein
MEPRNLRLTQVPDIEALALKSTRFVFSLAPRDWLLDCLGLQVVDNFSDSIKNLEAVSL